MGKNGSGLRIRDVCKLECETVAEILDRYHVSDEDKDEILDTIKEAYFQLDNACEAASATESAIRELFGEEKFEEVALLSMDHLEMG